MIDEREFNGVNEYIFTWKISLQGAAKTKFTATIGRAIDEGILPGLLTVGLRLNPSQIQVRTFDPSGKPAARPFHIARFRAQ